VVDVERILAMSKTYEQETVETLSKMVQIPSFSGREEQVCLLIKKMCEDAGFDEVYIDGLGSVVARLGNGPRILAFDAHIDTVEVGDLKQWTFDPFVGDVKDGLVRGLGTADQSGGAAAMISSGKMLKELNYAGDFTIYYTFTVMEEDCDGLAWLYLIEKEKLKPDYVVSTEPTACELYRGQRGRMEIEILLKGLSSHGSMPERGISAAYKAARAALAIEQLEEDLLPDADGFLGKGSVTVSQMEVTGPSQCAVADEARIYLDRRLTWGEDEELAIRQVKEYVTEALGEEPFRVYMPYYDKKGYKKTDFGQELYFPGWKMEEEHPLVQAAVRANEALYGEKLVPGPCRYSTNAVAFCGRHGIPAIVMGPGDVSACHRPDEMTRISDLVKCSALYTLLPYVL